MSIGGVTGTGGIVDATGVPSISSVEPGAAGVGDNNVNEGLDLVFNVGITGTSTAAVTYSLALAGVTATAGVDFNAVLSNASFSNGVTYSSATGLITVPAGVTGFAVTVPTLTDSVNGEPIETLSLSIGGVTGTGGIVDTEPLNTIPGAQSTAEDATQVFSSANGNALSVTDGDSASLTTTVAVTNGTLTAVAFAGAVIINNGSGSVTIIGSAAAITGALNGLSYAPSADYNGPAVLTLTTSDGSASDIDTVAITVTPVVDIANDSATTNEDTAVTIRVLANDSFESAGRTITAVNGLAITAGGAAVAVTNGSVTLNASGQLAFTPTTNVNGVVPTFSYTVTSNGVTETANVSITITPTDDSFTDANETVSVAEDTTLNGSVLTGTTSVDGPVTVTTFTIEGNATVFNAGQTATLAGVGTLTIAANGNYVFTPAANYNGPVPVATYTITDGSGTNDTSTLTITVTPVDDAFTDADETVSGAEDTVLTGSVLTGTTSADGTVTVTTFAIAGVAGSFTAGTTATIPSVGTLVINANGAFTFTPVANYNGSVPVVTYTMTDGSSGDTSTLTITIPPTDDAFTDADETISVAEDTTLNGSVLTGTTSVDGAVTVTTFTIVGVAGTFNAGQTATIASVGTLVINANGDYTFTPVANYNGTVPVVTYSMTDGSSGDTSTLNITVTPTDDSFTDANETVSVAEDTTLNGSVLTGTTSVDGPVTVTTFTIEGNATVFNAGQTATLAGVGTLTIAANGGYVFTPAANYNGPVPVATYTITDGSGANDTSTLTISIISASDTTGDDDDVNENRDTHTNNDITHTGVITNVSSDMSLSLATTTSNIKSNGQDVTYTWDSTTRTLTASTASVTVFTVTLNSTNTAYVFRQIAGIDHAVVAGENHSLVIPFSLIARNAMGSLIGNVGFTVTVFDDAPVVTGNLSIVTANDGAYSESGFLNLATVSNDVTKVTWNTNGLPNLVVDGKAVSYFDLGNGTLEGRLADGIVIVRATINPNIVDADNHPQYSFQITQPIGSRLGIVGTESGYTVVGGGNVSGKDLQFGTYLINSLLGYQADGTLSQVNTNNSWVGIGSGGGPGNWFESGEYLVMKFKDVSGQPGQVQALGVIVEGQGNASYSLAWTVTVAISPDGSQTATYSGIFSGASNADVNFAIPLQNGAIYFTDVTIKHLTGDFRVNFSGATANNYFQDIPLSLAYTLTDADGDTAGGQINTTLTVPPLISVADVSVDEAAGVATFAVTLDKASTQTITVQYNTSDVTAASGGDYTSRTGTITFAPGETSKSVSVLVINDSLKEDNETFNFNLSSATNANISKGVGTGTITDNDVTPTLTINDVSVNEGAGTATFTVTLSASSGQTVSVGYNTSNGTATTANNDYTVTSGNLTFAPGITTQTITVPIGNDTTIESTEAFNVNLVAPINATIADGVGIGTILDNDTPTLSVSNVSVSEGGGFAVFTVSLNITSATNTTVSLALANGTATVGTDTGATSALQYSTNGGTNWITGTSATIPSGATSILVRTAIVQDATVEPDETFTLTATRTAGSTTNTSATGTATIINDDVALTSTTGSTVTGLGLTGEYYGYNDNRTGVAADDATKFSGVMRIHSDDGRVAIATPTNAANTNLSNLAEVEQIVEGRAGDTALIGSARAAATGSDAAFTINTLEFGVLSGVQNPSSANALFSNDLGQSSARFTTGQTVTGNNLATFLQSNTSTIVATGGMGDTTDAAVRAVGYIYIPTTGNYDIRVVGDDGYRVLVNGVNLTEVDAIQPPTTSTFVNKALVGGIQPIEILYWDQAGHAMLRIEVKPSGAPDSAYEVLGTKSFALFGAGTAPTLSANQDLIETSDGVWAVRTGGTHNSDTGTQQVVGSAGSDSISTGADSDVLTGGAGNDRLTGGLGSDTFVWRLNDQGTASHPARDAITDFNTAAPTSGGDVLDLRDLLQGESATATSLSSYLHFTKSGADTILEVKHTGTGAVTQQIVLEGIDLTSNNTLTDSAIIQSLLNNNTLIVGG